ncbi:hemolysin D [Helicobacter aurati]|uniref:Hemolysin D n=1 Tax=Helicobacter aurati TaxID=137778 RepID=A0A3D8J8B8_9HELI|nr:HlyD family efflux transporter periplasmic adaptor subunit [Helicobacter aurati]RDU73749.1 hemolysin D [Helicobacter aurati]
MRQYFHLCRSFIFCSMLGYSLHAVSYVAYAEADSLHDVQNANTKLHQLDSIQAQDSKKYSVKIQKKEKKQDIFSFPTIKVSRLTIADSRRYYGTIQEDESRVYSLSVRADGFIEKLFVSQIYAPVKAQQPLFSFYAPEIVDAQSEFLATLPHSHLAQQKLLLLGVDSKEIARLRSSRKINNAVTFYAPFDGVVFAKNVNRGSGVKKGDEVFRIIDISTLWVIASINQEDLPFIRQNDNRTYVQIEGYQGKVAVTLDRIYPNIVDNFVRVRFVLPNNDFTFFPNAFAQVTIESSPKERLILPKNAVLFKNNKYFVFLNDDGEFIPQEIQARRILGTRFYEIIDGLEEGQSVIKDALFIVDSDAQNNGWFE